MVTPPPKKKAKPHHGKGSEKGSTKGSCVLKKGSGSKNKDTSKSDNPSGSKVDVLRVECELLSYMMSNMPKFSSALSLPASIFSYKKDTLTSVKSRDISEFLTKDFASIKVLQVYMMYVILPMLSHLILPTWRFIKSLSSFDLMVNDPMFAYVGTCIMNTYAP